ncbi:MAG: hypothetical protein DCC74_08650 [Proteobacteria bacterium]|nr:MAG: hypothetical protein DCC74_08650 [Pseudomonadota bacterium]
MPDFHSIITRHLANVDASRATERHTVYERVKDVLHKALEANPGQPELLGYLYELDQAIDEIERGYAAAPSKVDRLLAPIRGLSTQAKLKYGAIAGLVATIADFVKPVLELTVPVMAASAIGGIVLLAGSGLARKHRTSLLSGAFLCGLMFMFSFGWWSLQHVVRDADANGAFAEIVPGASAVQTAFLTRLGRIEDQTRRVGDLLEEQARRSAEEAREEAAMEEEFKRQERERKDLARQRIEIAGYRPDAEGMVKAFMDKSDVADAFDTLGIEPNEAAIRAVAATARTTDEIWRIAHLIKDRAARSPAIQKLQQAMAADGAKLAAAFQEAGAKATVCDSRNRSLVIGPGLLKKGCAQDGLRFANAYMAYHQAAYGDMPTPKGVEYVAALTHPVLYMRNATANLPVEKVAGTLWLGRVKDCTYYEGEIDYFFNGGLNYWGTLPTPGSNTITFFTQSLDKSFAEGAATRCPLADVRTGRARFCRARVILATWCEGTKLTIVKNLASLR